MKREDILAIYLDARGPEERRAIEVDHPELVPELRALAAVAEHVKSSALAQRALPSAAAAWRPPQAPAIGPARAAAIALSVFAISWVVSGNTLLSSQFGQLLQLMAMGGWLSFWWLRLSPGRSVAGRTLTGQVAQA